MNSEIIKKKLYNIENKIAKINKPTDSELVGERLNRSLLTYEKELEEAYRELSYKDSLRVMKGMEK